MAIKKYNEDGTEFYSVYVVKKSHLIPGLKICRGAKKLTSLTSAQRKEKALLKSAERDLILKENSSLSWESMILDWEEEVKSGSVFTKRITLQTLADYKTLLFKHTEDWLKISVNRIDLSMGWTTLDSVEREFSISRRKKLRSAIDSVYSWGILSGKIKGINQSPTSVTSI